jgi:hypothetical protein
MAALDVIFREGGIMPVAHSDLIQVYTNANYKHANADKGEIAWMRDKFGHLRCYTFRQNVSGSAFAAGDLTSRKLEVETNQTGTATTTVVGSFTADEHIGALAIVHDDAGAAGAAPEGEASIVASNSATVATLETDLPWSVALASGDDVTLISPNLIDSAANDPNFVVCGVAMGAPADDGWGWFQFQGVHPAAAHTAAAAISGSALKAGAAAVAVFGDATAVVGGTAGTGIGYVVGYQLAIHGSDVVTTKSPVIMSLLPAYM